MKAFRLSPAELDLLLQRWRKSHAVHVPTEEKRAVPSTDCAPGWRKMEEGDGALNLSVGPTPASVKTFYFPQPETLMTCTLENNHPDQALMRSPQPSEGMRVVVGVRPCDAQSVLLNDLVFHQDAFFQEKRRQTVLVGFTCDTMLSTCFCDRMGGSPLANEGLDLALSRTQDGFLVEVVSPKGESLVTGLELPQASKSDLAALAARRQDLGRTDSTRLAALKSCELNTLYEAPIWQPLGDSCINCGACTFICPTCYCFDIQDEVARGRGRRIRYWDSCMFPLYSLQTSGHNPRGKKVQRTRNRFLHKLKYFPDRFGPFSCVGCGRCVQDCPVNIDIREVLSDLTHLTGVE